MNEKDLIRHNYCCHKMPRSIFSLVRSAQHVRSCSKRCVKCCLRHSQRSTDDFFFNCVDLKHGKLGKFAVKQSDGESCPFSSALMSTCFVTAAIHGHFWILFVNLQDKQAPRKAALKYVCNFFCHFV